MNKNLGTLAIHKLIVHDVPARRAGEAEPAGPVLSEIESQLNAELKTYFRERIIETLNSSVDVDFDPGTTSPIPQLVLNHLGTATTIVPDSQQMAQHLFAVQTGANPAGLLMVIRGTLEGAPMIAILKLEREEGIRAHFDEVGGQRTFAVEHLRDLMLTKHSRVFKASLFFQEGTGESGIRGAVSDNQRGFQAVDVADFFLKKFLGCRLLTAPELVTRDFLRVTEAFINEDVPEAETKARYQVALIATLGSQQTVVRPGRFAQENLETGDRQPYLRKLREAGLPATQFDKDLQLVKGQITRLQMDFQSGIAVLGTPEALEHHASITTTDSGATRVEIEDTLKHVRGHR